MSIEIKNHSEITLKRKNDVLLILGDGRTMPEDRSLFRSWGIPHDLGAIGRSIKICDGRADHWWNADGETAIAWVKQIKAQSKNGLLTHSLGPVEGFDVDWDIQQPDYHYKRITGEKGRIHGSSSLFAALTAIAMGYQKIVLAGCPMDSEGHWYFEPTGPETLGPIWLGLDFMAWLDFAKDPRSKRIRSLSGYTADILGEATKSWCDYDFMP